MNDSKRATWIVLIVAVVLAVLAWRRPWWLRWWALLLWALLAVGMVQAVVVAVAEALAGAA